MVCKTKKNYAGGRFITVLLRLVVTKADNFWEFLTLELHHLKRLGYNYSLTEHHIPKEGDLQIHYCKKLNRNFFKIIQSWGA